MAFTITVKVHMEGLTETQRRAPELDGIMMDLISADIQAGAQSRAAVRTGFMRDNIKRYVGGSRFQVIAEAGYSGFVEYGTRFMAAQPFVTPAVEACDVDGYAQEALKRIGL